MGSPVQLAHRVAGLLRRSLSPDQASHKVAVLDSQEQFLVHFITVSDPCVFGSPEVFDSPFLVLAGAPMLMGVKHTD